MQQSQSQHVSVNPLTSPDLFFEWSELRDLIQNNPHVKIQWQEYGLVTYQGQSYPLISFSFGSQDITAPTLGLVSGVHGVERIGVQTLLALLNTFFSRASWDKATQSVLSKIRFCVFPFVNPVGIKFGLRSNANGVDLMRNSPIKVKDKVYPLYGGHRISPILPWYQGDPDTPEAETQAVYQFFNTQLAHAKILISLDFHSGFGMQDRLWFPYAYRREPFEDFSQVTQFFNLFDKSYPHHFYKIEPTSHQYQISGDLWDKLFVDFKQKNPDSTYLPLTLEMGSWLWVKKNPSQIFSRWGLFHPLKAHRQKRVLRRHITFFDFVIRALLNPDSWAILNNVQKEQLWSQGLKRWYL